jgi:hypothetical protein
MDLRGDFTSETGGFTIRNLESTIKNFGVPVCKIFNDCDLPDQQ